ncbi:MAG TPA: CBS domain-containing protein [Actinomycetota bacterium]|nr:CBS domain-containing protein [Actinomycetota bacterium]
MAILVRHAMTESPTTISPGMNAFDAAGMMKSQDVGVLPVVEDTKLVGLVTDRDLVLRVLAERKNPIEVTVGDICTSSPVTVTPDMKLSEARELMEQHKVRRLPVMKGEELVGVLSLGDVAWADASTREVGEALQAVSESDRTRSTNEQVDRGTPERVQENREEA